MASPHHEAPPRKAAAGLSNPPNISLEDVASRAGLDFHHVSGDPLNKNIFSKQPAAERQFSITTETGYRTFFW